MSLEKLQTSRSGRKLLKRVQKAHDRREDMLQKGKVGVEPGAGRVAIYASGAVSYRDRAVAYNPDKIKEQHNRRIEEAEALRDRLSPHHAYVDVDSSPTTAKLKRDFKDPEVTDIIMIGHGSMGGLLLQAPAGNQGYFTWLDAANATTHLKQGRVEQRTCTSFPEELGYSVPIGTFAVLNTLNVFTAAPNHYVPLPDGSPRDHLFSPIFKPDIPLLDQLHDMNQKYSEQPKLIVEEPVVHRN